MVAKGGHIVAGGVHHLDGVGALRGADIGCSLAVVAGVGQNDLGAEGLKRVAQRGHLGIAHDIAVYVIGVQDDDQPLEGGGQAAERQQEGADLLGVQADLQQIIQRLGLQVGLRQILHAEHGLQRGDNAVLGDVGGLLGAGLDAVVVVVGHEVVGDDLAIARAHEALEHGAGDAAAVLTLGAVHVVGGLRLAGGDVAVAVCKTGLEGVRRERDGHVQKDGVLRGVVAAFPAGIGLRGGLGVGEVDEGLDARSLGGGVGIGVAVLNGVVDGGAAAVENALAHAGGLDRADIGELSVRQVLIHVGIAVAGALGQLAGIPLGKIRALILHGDGHLDGIGHTVCRDILIGDGGVGVRLGQTGVHGELAVVDGHDDAGRALRRAYEHLAGVHVVIVRADGHLVAVAVDVNGDYVAIRKPGLHKLLRGDVQLNISVFPGGFAENRFIGGRSRFVSGFSPSCGHHQRQRHGQSQQSR